MKLKYYIFLIILVIFFSINENVADLTFSNIRNIEILNTSEDDFGPYFYKKSSILFYNSSISGKSQFYISYLQNGFSSPKLSPDEINNYKENQAYIAFLNDNEAIFSKFQQFSTRSNVNLFKIAYKNGKFQTPEIISNLTKNNYFSQVTSTFDSKYIYYISDENTNNLSTDIYCTLKSEFFNNCTNLNNISSPKSEITPFLKSDDSLFFSSNGFGGKGGYDIFLSVKENGIWQRPVPLDELNTEYNESDFIIINDTLAIFSSDRTGGKGKMDLYSSSILKPSNKIKTLLPTDSNFVLNISATSDNIIINKTIEKYFVIKNNNIEVSTKVDYGIEPKFWVYNLDKSDNVEIKNINFYLDDAKVDSPYLFGKHNELIFNLETIIEKLIDSPNEVDIRLDIFYNDQRKSFISKKNIIENESIYNRISTFRNQDFFAIELSQLTTNITNKIVDFLNENKYYPYALLINNNLEQKANLLKTKLIGINKNLIIETSSSSSILYFRNK